MSTNNEYHAATKNRAINITTNDWAINIMPQLNDDRAIDINNQAFPGTQPVALSHAPGTNAVMFGQPSSATGYEPPLLKPITPNPYRVRGKGERLDK